MHLLLVHQYYKTPEEGSGIRTWYISRELVRLGHHVTILSGHNQKSGLETEDGVNIQYFKIPYKNQFPFWRRLIAFGQFVIACKNYLRKNHEFDLLYVLTTPLSTGFVALYAKRKFKIPFVFEVGDLWPEVPKSLEIIRNKQLLKWLYDFETKIYLESKQVVGLSVSIKEYIEYTLDYKKEVSVLTNFSDCSFFDKSAVPEKFDAKNPLTIAYAGALGYVNHISFLLDLIKVSEKKNLPLNFIILGDGTERKSLIEKAKGLSNVSFPEPGGKEKVKSIFESSHAVYLSYLKEDILSTGCPNKYMDGLAAGKLIISNFQGWIKKEIETEECGFYYNPTKPEEFFNLVEPFVESPLLLEQFQINSRKLAEEKYEVQHALKIMPAILN